MKNILGIIGAGVLGQHIAHYAVFSDKFSEVVFFDDTINPGTENGIGKVIGNISHINQFIRSGKIQNLLIGIGYKHFDTRETLYHQFASSIHFPNIIHDSCYIDNSVLLGNGNIILPGCVVDKGCVLGNNIFLNPGCIVAHDNKIGDHTFFGPGVTTSGFVSIGTCCFLGTGTNMVDNITIGDNVLTGAGTLITGNFVKPGLYYGNPGRLKKKSNK